MTPEYSDDYPLGDEMSEPYDVEKEKELTE